jgi:outer membrane protein TolC
MSRSHITAAALPVWLMVLVAGCVPGSPGWLVFPEQRHLDIREPSQFPKAPLPAVPPPATVSEPSTVVPEELALDKAIHIALANSKAVRILAGVTGAASGQTIYDAAISNTSNDVARAVFDPTLTVKNTWNRFNIPAAIFDPTSPIGVSVPQAGTDQYSLSAVLSQKNLLGGTASLDSEVTHLRFPASPFSNTLGLTTFAPLNPELQSSITMSYTQPLLRGAGRAANLAPIVIARINTELSFYQYKDSVQDLVRGVIDAYWSVVSARTDVWAKQQQVQQGQFGYDLADARRRAGLGSTGAAAQAKVALYNFKANLIGSEAILLQREAALRYVMGVAPTNPPRLTLTTPLNKDRIEPRWEEMLRLAGDSRPDLLELKLTIESDQQSWILANNQAHPQLDLVSYYKWYGLEGVSPTGVRVATQPGQFGDWSVGVNFSLPLGMRQDRAKLRSAELTLVRDRANLEQGMHNAIHVLAGNARNIAQYYEQYQAFKATRFAARENLDQQLADFKAGRAIYLNVLQAISDWGNAITAEAQALTQYNTELANLEKQTGTILETHGVNFMEERYRAIGPLGRAATPKLYPAAIPPTPNAPVYPLGTEPAEKALELERPSLPARPPVPQMGPALPELPAPRPLLGAPMVPDGAK